eukprot:scaffold1356_cov123-Cylindrotheca_fusiformis.AAC.16
MSEEEVEEIAEVLDDDGAEPEEEEAENKVPLMDDSGQTKEERRAIRRAQRKLFKEVEENGETLEVDDVRGRNNEIFHHVRHTREAVLDGENVKLIANRAVQKVDRLIQVPRYDADRLVSKLAQKCKSGTNFDWSLLGTQAGVCFNAVPSCISFLNGPLADGRTLEVKQKAKRPRQKEEEDVEEERPEEVKEGQSSKDPDQLSAIEQSMKVLKKTLHKRVNQTYEENKRKLNEVYHGQIPPKLTKKLKKHGVEICAMRYLINPKSFTQTVENLFHYSFLIKRGHAAMRVNAKGFGEYLGEDSRGGMFVKYVGEQKDNPEPKQAILSLTMKDWRDLCKAYDVTVGDLPHRTGSKQARQIKSQMSQSSSS